ncbi:tetratricopeptide repeat protein [Candidatus Entotheonella palauensis]|nr:tetratricopeptide repeat protein [Candidatus Entotheonella palauensis]
MIVVRQIDDAKAIRKQLRQGASFCYLAKTKSIAPSRKQWGLSGVVDLDDVQPQLQAILRKMKPGQISDVTTLDRNYAIIKVLAPQVPQLLETAKQQMNQGQIKTAMQTARQLLKLEKDNVPARMLLGVALSESKDFKESFKVIKQARDDAPTEAQILMLLGAVYTKAAFETEKRAYSKDAIDAFQQAIKLNKRFAPAAHLGLGHVHLNLLKQPKKAIPYLKKAADQTPQLARAHQYLIQAYIETKTYPEAWKHMRYAQSQGFRFPELLAQLHKIKKSSK